MKLSTENGEGDCNRCENATLGQNSNVFFKESGDLNLGERNIRRCNFVFFVKPWLIVIY